MFSGSLASSATRGHQNWHQPCGRRGLDTVGSYTGQVPSQYPHGGSLSTGAPWLPGVLRVVLPCPGVVLVSGFELCLARQSGAVPLRSVAQLLGSGQLRIPLLWLPSSSR